MFWNKWVTLKELLESEKDEKRNQPGKKLVLSKSKRQLLREEDRTTKQRAGENSRKHADHGVRVK